MYTLKMIIDGDTSLRAEHSLTLSRFGGKLYNKAMQLVEESKNQQMEFDGQSLPMGTEVSGVDAQTVHDKPLALEVAAVELCLEEDQHIVICASREGNRQLDTAIGVVVTDLEHGARYEFVYPGDQVYVVNSEGRTIETLR